MENRNKTDQKERCTSNTATLYTPLLSKLSLEKDPLEAGARGLFATKPHKFLQYDAVKGKYHGFLNPKVPKEQGTIKVRFFYLEDSGRDCHN